MVLMTITMVLAAKVVAEVAVDADDRQKEGVLIG
jgi:hypothetical protein